MGEKAVGEMGEKSLWVKKHKTYVSNNHLGATHMGEKSVDEKTCG